MRDDPLFRITIPSKTQAYLMMGKPILMGVSRDAAELVRDAGAGVAFTPDDPKDLMRAVLQLAESSADELAAMGRAGREFYREKLALSVGSAKLGELLTSSTTTGLRHRPGGL